MLRELSRRRRDGHGRIERWFKVRCDCGVTWDTRTRALVGNRRINSCGCLNGELRRRFNKRLGRIAGLSTKFKQYKLWCARAKGRSFTLSFRAFKTLVLGDCSYCGLPASQATKGLNGIDRVDNSLGYSIKNCVPCCKTCNHAKATMAHSDFIAWIERLLKHHGARR